MKRINATPYESYTAIVIYGRNSPENVSDVIRGSGSTITMKDSGLLKYDIGEPYSKRKTYHQNPADTRPKILSKDLKHLDRHRLLFRNPRNETT